MTVYGVTPTGFVRKTLRNILDDLSASQRSTISASLDTSSDTVIGQLSGIFARELGIAWEQIELCYHGNDPDACEDALLTMVCKITGTIRRAASPSLVVLSCNLNIGTVLLAGINYAAIDGRLDVRWTPAKDYTAIAGGAQDVDFVSEQLGPVQGFAGTITAIVTSVSGWNSVTNVLDAEPGRVIDPDPVLRVRREEELAATGSTTVAAILANAIQAFPTIQNIFCFENDKDTVDGITGNPPHSLEVLIYDGPSPSVDNDALAQLIWDTKAGGIQTVGTTTGTAVIDSRGNTFPVHFTRATEVPVYLLYTFKTGPGYVGDAAAKDYIAVQANALQAPSSTVIAIVAKSLPLSRDVAGKPALAGIVDITAFTLGTAPAPVGTINLPMGLRSIARFDTSRIGITDT